MKQATAMVEAPDDGGITYGMAALVRHIYEGKDLSPIWEELMARVSADPNDAGILRIERVATNRVRTLVVEDRRPGDAGIGRLPHAARRNGREVVRAIGRMDRETDNAARHERRANRPQLEPRHRMRLGGFWPVIWFLFGRLRDGKS